MGCCLWGRTESDTTEVTQQQQQQEGSLGKKGHMHIRAESLCSAPETVTALSISYVRVCAEPFQLCPTFWGPKDHSPPGCPIHGILQAKILEWVAISSRGSSQARDWTYASCIIDRFFTIRKGSPLTNLYIQLHFFIFETIIQHRNMHLIPGWGRSPGEGNGNPPQHSCLGNSMNRGSWLAPPRVHRELNTTEGLIHFM